MGIPDDIIFMQRCFQLAILGAGNVAPNPMVGAVLVCDGVIIGEGCHQQYGEAHAEVYCIEKALENHSDQIDKSTLYVSLEPCSHFGKTPPCADLIIKHRIPKVIIGCRDRFDAVNGRGIEKLKAAGITIIEGVLEDDAVALNKRFFTFHQNKRPYIILKWAQTKDGIIATGNNNRLLISNEVTNRLVHRWRTEEAGIMIGAGTAIKDDPLLDNRNWYGSAPVKIVVSGTGDIPGELRLFQGATAIIMNTQKEKEIGNKIFEKIPGDHFLENIMKAVYNRNLQSVLVEGGQRLLQSLIDADLWDEARIITNTTLIAGNGLAAPKLTNQELLKTQHILSDEVCYYKNHNNSYIKNNV